jgi:hypothetical protein
MTARPPTVAAAAASTRIDGRGWRTVSSGDSSDARLVKSKSTGDSAIRSCEIS